MFVPYVTAVPPYYSLPIGPMPINPMQMGYLPNGLSHAGIPIQTSPYWINPLQVQNFPSYGYGTYGYRPVPYGYGLSHSGLGYENIHGYGPQPLLPHYGGTPIQGYSPIQSALQPNWSPIGGIPQQPV